jgi:hypothetical protein
MSLERSTPPNSAALTIDVLAAPRGVSEIRRIVSDILGDHPAAYDGAGPGLPADPARDGGLGLAIVGALATKTGAEVTEDGRYTVWARIGPPDGTAARTETGAPQPAHSACDSVPPCPAPGDDQTPEDTP